LTQLLTAILSFGLFFSNSFFSFKSNYAAILVGRAESLNDDDLVSSLSQDFQQRFSLWGSCEIAVKQGIRTDHCQSYFYHRGMTMRDADNTWQAFPSVLGVGALLLSAFCLTLTCSFILAVVALNLYRCCTSELSRRMSLQLLILRCCTWSWLLTLLTVALIAVAQWQLRCQYQPEILPCVPVISVFDAGFWFVVGGASAMTLSCIFCWLWVLGTSVQVKDFAQTTPEPGSAGADTAPDLEEGAQSGNKKSGEIVGGNPIHNPTSIPCSDKGDGDRESYDEVDAGTESIRDWLLRMTLTPAHSVALEKVGTNQHK
jgi:hypothetical protein